MQTRIIQLLLMVSVIQVSCNTGKSSSNQEGQTDRSLVTQKGGKMNVVKNEFGTTKSGERVCSFILHNNNGVEVEIIEYGAIVSGIKVPDKEGIIADITLGYDNLEAYEKDTYYFGATIGRVANRIGGAQVIVDGEAYDLEKNTLPDFGPNHLHGGVKGFNKVLWSGEEYTGENEVGVKLSYLSRDGEEGYPGNLKCEVIYSLNEENELGITYKACTDKTTLVNFTHHSYFNLASEGKGTIFDHEIMINASKYTIADDDLIPTGEIANVNGLPVDFTEKRTIGYQFDKMQMAKFKGYDLNYILNNSDQKQLKLACKVEDPHSGRVMEVYTTQLCMHFYTSNFLVGKPGKGGKPYKQNSAFCLEPQAYPDASNKPGFPSVELRPGEEYKQSIIYRFL